MNILRFLVPKSLVVYIPSDATVRQAYEKMRYHSYVAIPVLDEAGVYLGTLRKDDVYRYFSDKGALDFRSAEKDNVKEILDINYSRPLYHTSSIEEMLEGVREHNFVAVVDDRGCFIGIILRRDVLDFLFTYYKKAEQEKTSGENK